MCAMCLLACEHVGISNRQHASNCQVGRVETLLCGTEILL